MVTFSRAGWPPGLRRVERVSRVIVLALFAVLSLTALVASIPAFYEAAAAQLVSISDRPGYGTRESNTVAFTYTFRAEGKTYRGAGYFSLRDRFHPSRGPEADAWVRRWLVENPPGASVEIRYFRAWPKLNGYGMTMAGWFVRYALYALAVFIPACLLLLVANVVAYYAYGAPPLRDRQSR